jgi:MFS family permease
MRRDTAIGWFPRVLVVNFVQSVTMHGMRPMISYRALSIGAGPAEIGLISACFGIFSLIVAVPAGRWIDRFGESRFMIAGTAIIGVVGLILVQAVTVPALAFAMLFLGVGQIISAVAIQTLIANGGAPDERDQRFGTQTVIASLGQLVGPAVAGLIVAQSMTASGTDGSSIPVSATDAVFALGAVTAFIATAFAVSLWRWPPPEHANADRPTGAGHGGSMFQAIAKVMRIRSIPQAMLASMVVLSCIDILTVYLPVYGVVNDVPVATIGLLLAVRGLASMTARVLMMPMLRRLGRRRLLIVAMVVPAVMFVLLPLAGANVVALTAIMALIGAGLGLCQPLTLTWVASQSPVEIRGTAIGVRLSANRFGQFAIPALAGGIAGLAGLTVIFWSLAGLLAVSAALVTSAVFTPPTARPTPSTAAPRSPG